MDSVATADRREWVEMDAGAIHQKVSHSLRHRTPASQLGEDAPGNDKARSDGTEHPEAATVSRIVLDTTKEQEQVLAPARSSLSEGPLTCAKQVESCSRNKSFCSRSNNLDRSEHRVGSRALYLFDDTFRVTTNECYFVTFRLTSGNNTSIHRANLVVGMSASPAPYWPPYEMVPASSALMSRARQPRYLLVDRSYLSCQQAIR
jgi:hypothetical protein